MGCTMVQCIEKMKKYNEKKDEKDIEDWFNLTGGGWTGGQGNALQLDGSQTVQEFYFYLAEFLKKMINAEKNLKSKLKKITIRLLVKKQ